MRKVELNCEARGRLLACTLFCPLLSACVVVPEVLRAAAPSPGYSEAAAVVLSEMVNRKQDLSPTIHFLYQCPVGFATAPPL